MASERLGYPASSPSGETGALDGEICKRCGQPVAATCPSFWRTDDALWNEVEGGHGGIRCIPCFTRDCEEKGVRISWRAVREPSGDGERGAGTAAEQADSPERIWIYDDGGVLGWQVLDVPDPAGRVAIDTDTDYVEYVRTDSPAPSPSGETGAAWTCAHGVTYTGSEDFLSGARNAHSEFEHPDTASLNDIAQQIIERAPEVEPLVEEFFRIQSAAHARLAAASGNGREDERS